MVGNKLSYYCVKRKTKWYYYCHSRNTIMLRRRRPIYCGAKDFFQNMNNTSLIHYIQNNNIDSLYLFFIRLEWYFPLLTKIHSNIKEATCRTRLEVSNLFGKLTLQARMGIVSISYLQDCRSTLVELCVNGSIKTPTSIVLASRMLPFFFHPSSSLHSYITWLI